MKLSHREEIAAPIDAVFAKVSDFSHFEQVARQRGADVERRAAGGPDGVGASWLIAFEFRGKRREVEATVTEVRPADGYVIDTTSSGLDGTVTIDLVALAPGRTRMDFGLDLKPRTMTARVLLQSLKLMKGSLESRLQSRLGGLARRIEADQKR